MDPQWTTMYRNGQLQGEVDQPTGHSGWIGEIQVIVQ